MKLIEDRMFELSRQETREAIAEYIKAHYDGTKGLPKNIEASDVRFKSNISGELSAYIRCGDETEIPKVRD